MRVVVADDEALARNELVYLLERHPDVVIVGEAADGREVLAKISQLKPDVIFLDIHMPGIDGMAAAKEIRRLEHSPYIVFATAFDDHALEAFALEAVDYILKPFSPERVDSTLERLRKIAATPNVTQETLSGALEKLRLETKRGPKRIAVTTADKTLFIDPQEIVYIYREDREVWICLTQERYRSTHALHELEEKLASYSFFRPHRGYIVNLQHVSAITPWFNGAYQLIMKDKAESVIPVSRNLVKALYEALAL